MPAGPSSSFCFQELRLKRPDLRKQNNVIYTLLCYTALPRQKQIKENKLQPMLWKNTANIVQKSRTLIQRQNSANCPTSATDCGCPCAKNKIPICFTSRNPKETFKRAHRRWLDLLSNIHLPPYQAWDNPDAKIKFSEPPPAPPPTNDLFPTSEFQPADKREDATTSKSAGRYI